MIANDQQKLPIIRRAIPPIVLGALGFNAPYTQKDKPQVYFYD